MHNFFSVQHFHSNTENCVYVNEIFSLQGLKINIVKSRKILKLLFSYEETLNLLEKFSYYKPFNFTLRQFFLVFECNQILK